MKPGKHGLARIIAASSYSLAGLKSCYKNEAAFRQELILFVLLLPVLILLPFPAVFKALLFSVNCLVLIVELLNSAIEALVDLVSPDYHVLAGRAKDMGSGAVLLSICCAAVLWAWTIIMLLLT